MRAGLCGRARACVCLFVCVFVFLSAFFFPRVVKTAWKYLR